ncbi:MAG: MBL fold metallo-hydrolase [Candidatus Aminicenantales bacterium]
MKRRKFIAALAAGLSFPRITEALSGQQLMTSEKSEKNREKTETVVKVLGTAQDGGFPHFGCYCKNCHRARAKPGFSRFISSLALIDMQERKAFILDASPDIRPQLDMIRAGMDKEEAGLKYLPQGIILTHAHIGHYTGLVFFGYEASNSLNLPVYCSERMASFLEKNGPWSQLVRLKNISLQPFPMEKEISLTPHISIIPFTVPHRDEYTDTIGFMIKGRKKKLLYIPDISSWEAWEKSIVNEVSRVEIAILDGTFYSPQELPGRDLSKIGHPFIKSSLERLKDVAARKRSKIFFTHLNHTNPALDPGSKERAEIKKSGFRLASDGREFYL